MQLATELDPYVQRQVADELGLYVYMLVDPRDSVPFYAGRGAVSGWQYTGSCSQTTS